MAKASLTVTAASQTIAFGGTLAPYTASLSGFVNGDTAATATTGLPTLSTTPATPTAVGSYPVTATLGSLAAANYTFTFVNGTVTIGVGTPSIVFSVANQTYGAAPFPVSATSNSTGAFTYSVVSGPATISGATVTLTGAGTVILKASEAADSSYAAASQTATFTVAKASLTVTAASQTIAFGGTLAPYTASLSGFVNGDTAATATTGLPTLSTTPATPTAVGSYPVTATLGSLAASELHLHLRQRHRHHRRGHPQHRLLGRQPDLWSRALPRQRHLQLHRSLHLLGGLRTGHHLRRHRHPDRGRHRHPQGLRGR